MANKKYWLKEEASRAVSHLMTYNQTWNAMETTPIRQAWIRNFLAYNSTILKSSSWDSALMPTGAQGEMLTVLIPKARSLIRQLVSLITKTKISFRALAKSSGEDIMKDVQLANNIMNSVVEDQKLDLLAEQLVENSLVMGSGYLKTTWQTDKGEPYDYTRGMGVVYSGGIQLEVLDVFSCIFDNTAAGKWDDLPWVSCLTLRNRYDLISQHKSLEQGLLAVPSYEDLAGPNFWFNNQVNNNQDTICVWETYCKRSPALPNGRMIIWADESTILYDGPNPYTSCPVQPLTPEPILATGGLLGYPLISNLLPSQEMFDNSASSISSNQAAFGTQNVLVPRGSNISSSELSGGMRMVQYTPAAGLSGGGKPEPLQLTASAPEQFKFMQDLDNYMQQLSKVHKIMSGDTAGVTSGSMVATLLANAVEEIDSLSKAYHMCLEKSMFNVVNAYKNFAKIPQKVTVYGKRPEAVTQREFTGKDLEKVAGVSIQTQNPLMQSVAGRLEVAAQLAQIPDQDSKYDYVQILEGRPLDDVLDKFTSQTTLVHSENESLMRGEEVIAIATDSHPFHVREHSKLLNSPEVRRSNTHISAILEHIQEHVQLEKETSPELLSMIRGTPMAMPQQGQQPPPQMAEEMLAPPSEEEGVEKESRVASPAEALGPQPDPAAPMPALPEGGPV